MVSVDKKQVNAGAQSLLSPTSASQEIWQRSSTTMTPIKTASTMMEVCGRPSQLSKTADLSGLTSNPNDTSVPAEMMLGHGLVGWNVQLSPDLPEGAVGQVYIQVTQANLTISSHNATQGSNPTSATSNATNILNETNATENFYATSGNLTSENRTIPIKIGNPTVAAATSGSPIPSFEAAFAVVGLVIVAYVVSRRR